MSQDSTRKYNISDNYKLSMEPGILRELNPNGHWNFADRISVVGYDDNVGLTYEDIDNTDNNFDYDTAGARLSIQSTSNDDGIGNIGIQALYLEGLDTDYNLLTEVVVLTGTTGVLTDNTFLRLKRTRVVLSGSNKTAVGTITITGDSFTWSKIDPGNYTCLLGRYTVPAGHSLILTGTNVSSGKNGDFEVLLMLKSDVLPEQNASHLLNNNNFILVTNDPALIPEKTDLWWKAKRDSGGGGDTRITSGFSGVVFNNFQAQQLFR